MKQLWSRLVRSNIPAKEKKKVSVAREWLNAVTFAVVAATLIRWTTVEAFVVPTPSMENTIMVGDYLFVSKFHYGTRTVRTPLQIPLTHQKIWGTNIPSYLDWVELPSYRLPGISEVKREDVVVFNVPPAYLSDRPDYPLDLKQYYVKRCVGLPGDRLEIRDRLVFANGVPLSKKPAMKWSYLVTAKDEISRRNFAAMGVDSDDRWYLGRLPNGEAAYRLLLTEDQQKYAATMPWITSVQDDYTTHDGPDEGIFPALRNNRWNGDNYGPLLVPHQGLTLEVTPDMLATYGELIIQYDNPKHTSIEQGHLLLHGKTVTHYTFQQNHYFMMGDNRHNSLDSRYWGFVPEDHLVGKALFIWFSVNHDADWTNKVRWNRIFTSID